MANFSCPKPFLSGREFNSSIGYVTGRYCGSQGGLSCCLPCPLSQWVFDDAFMATEEKLRWASPFSLAACAFLLLSWIVVPKEYSQRHYLSFGLVVYAMCISLALAIPLANPPDTCANAITPADHRSDVKCAWTGSLFTLGGLGVPLWIFLRVVWLHICVCWDRVPGKVFIALSMATGIAVPVIFLGAAFASSGFSYSLGSTCFINHEHSFALFWGWLVGLACASLLLQLVTTGYCIWIFVASHRMRQFSVLSTSTSSSWGSIKRFDRLKKREQKDEERAVTMARRRERWKGIQRILMMQWRIIVLAVALVIQGLYFGSLSWASVNKAESLQGDPRALAFGLCLFASNGDRSKCWKQAEYLVVNKKATLAGLGVMALSGIQAAILLSHFSLFKGWYQVLRQPSLILPSNRRRSSARLSQHSFVGNHLSNGLYPAPGLIPLRSPDYDQPASSDDAGRSSEASEAPMVQRSRGPSINGKRISSPIAVQHLPSGIAVSIDNAVLGSISPRSSTRASTAPQATIGSPRKAPARPQRPQTLHLDDELAINAGAGKDPPVPLHLISSGIAYPEQLPVWVRTMPGDGPVIDLRGSAMGGLRLNPVNLDELPSSPKWKKEDRREGEG